MHAKNDRDDGSRTQIEDDARAAVELGAHRPLTDVEWTVTRARILEFAGILRVWDQKTAESKQGNVEVPCEQEP
jgi:hypothetical protein